MTQVDVASAGTVVSPACRTHLAFSSFPSMRRCAAQQQNSMRVRPTIWQLVVWMGMCKAFLGFWRTCSLSVPTIVVKEHKSKSVYMVGSLCSVYLKHGIWREVKYQRAVSSPFFFFFLQSRFVGCICCSSAVKRHVPIVTDQIFFVLLILIEIIIYIDL